MDYRDNYGRIIILNKGTGPLQIGFHSQRYYTSASDPRVEVWYHNCVVARGKYTVTCNGETWEGKYPYDVILHVSGKYINYARQTLYLSNVNRKKNAMQAVLDSITIQELGTLMSETTFSHIVDFNNNNETNEEL
jgi:hypothetical protein